MQQLKKKAMDAFNLRNWKNASELFIDVAAKLSNKSKFGKEECEACVYTGYCYLNSGDVARGFGFIVRAESLCKITMKRILMKVVGIYKHW